MAVKGRFRLLSAHYFPGDLWLPGDKEMLDLKGEDAGTVVGDGTQYPVQWPTLEMFPLDEEAEKAIEAERERLNLNAGAMDPVNNLPPTVGDDFENNWVPGLNVRRTPAKEHGAPARSVK